MIMIKYFIEKRNILQVEIIILELNKKKERMSHSDFSDPYREYANSKVSFNEVLEIAKQQNDETLANSQYVVRMYFLLLSSLCDYFELLRTKQYRNSWNKLQDCIYLAQQVGSYTNIEDRFEIPNILCLLSSYETLYPYSVFASGEYIVLKSHCSICQESMLSLDCPHIKGQLYWGEVATEIIDNIKTIQAIALVRNPVDKRCVIEPAGDKRPEIDKFKRVDQFLELNLPFLQDFSIDKKIEKRKYDDIEIMSCNDPRPCGSEIEFIKCCDGNLYYDHELNIVTPLENIKLRAL